MVFSCRWKRVAITSVVVQKKLVRNTWGKHGLVHSMFSSSTGLFSFQFSSMDGLDAMLENGLSFIQNHPLILKKWHSDENLLNEGVSTIPGRSSYARVMIELRADVKLKDNIIMAMPKITREGHYLCNVRVEYEWKPPSNSNLFEVLNSVDNDVELGTNGGTINLVNNEATSSGFSFMNIDNNSTRTTPIIDKIGKFEELLTSGKATLVDEAGNPLKKVEFSDDYDSEDEVASVNNDMARSMASESVGVGTQSLREQWRDSYGNGDYNEGIIR
ncbi:hypothetical protein Tco_0834589 [Tanacetum coccineum]